MAEEQIKKAYAKVRNKFNFDLSSTQIKIISNIVQGKDVFAVLPTGGGKSMTFIVPPLLSSVSMCPFTSFIIRLRLLGLNICET